MAMVDYKKKSVVDMPEKVKGIEVSQDNLDLLVEMSEELESNLSVNTDNEGNLSYVEVRVPDEVRVSDEGNEDGTDSHVVLVGSLGDILVEEENYLPVSKEEFLEEYEEA